MMSENSKEAYNTLKALTKTQQRKLAVIEDSSGNILTESTAVLNRWTEYCDGLFTYELHRDTSLLQSIQTPREEAESLPSLGEEVEEVVRNLKAGKSAVVDNISSKLLKNGDETTITVLRKRCNNILETQGMAEGVDTIARRTFIRGRRQHQAMSELSYHHISLHTYLLTLRTYLRK